MAKDRAIIFITKDTLQTFKVIDEKYEALNSKGISYINYSSEADIEEYAETLKSKYNIDDFSEIEIVFSIINLGAEEKYLDKLKALLDGTEKIEVNNVEKLIPLIMASKGEIKTNTALQEEYEIALQKLERLENEKNELIEFNEKLNDKIEELNKEVESLENKIESEKERQKKESQLKEQKKLEEEKLSESIYKIDFVKDAENSGVVLSIPKGKKVTFHKKFTNGDVVSKGALIATYYASQRWTFSDEINIVSKKSGRIYYMVNDNSDVKNGDIIAVIGEKTWTKDDAIFFLKQKQNSEIVKKNENEPVIVKAGVIMNFVSEDSERTPSFIIYKSGIKDLKDGDLVTENQNILEMEDSSNTKVLIKAPCSGQIFFLFDKSPYFRVDNPATSLAMVVPESWSKSQAVEWYRSVEPSKETKVIRLEGSIENIIPDGAWVLPNDKFARVWRDTGFFTTDYTEFENEGFCKMAGKIRYKECKKMNERYYPTGPVAEIY